MPQPKVGKDDGDSPKSPTFLTTVRECGQVYRDLFAASSVPAMDVLCSRNTSPVRKAVWTLALIPLVCYTIKEMTAVLKEYFEYSVAVTFKYDTNDTFEFPDVTICNVNPLRRSRLCSGSWEEKGMDGRLYERLCGRNQRFKDPNMEDFEFQKNFSLWLASRQGEDLRGYGHQFSDTVIDCTYAEQDCRDEKYFHFHFDPMYGNCFCFHCHKDAPEEEKFFTYGTLSSPHNGLVITLNIEIGEYLPMSYEAGFLVMIHAHDTRASVCSNGVYITPGYTTYVGLTVMMQTGLPYPYASACRKEWPTRLQPYVANPGSVYTREECLTTCLQFLIVQECGCQGQFLPLVNAKHNASQHQLAVCTGEKADCALRRYSTETSKVLEQECGCNRPCREVYHDREVTLTEFLVSEASAPNKNVKSPLSRLVIYFSTLTFENIESVAKYDGNRVLSNVGGINGIYIGLSFFILFQVLDILVMGAVKIRRRRAQRLREPPSRTRPPDRGDYAGRHLRTTNVWLRPVGTGHGAPRYPIFGIHARNALPIHGLDNRCDYEERKKWLGLSCSREGHGAVLPTKRHFF